MTIDLVRDRPCLWPGGFLAATSTGVPPLVFDCTIREDHSASWAWSSSPVETGAQITDHGQPQPVPLIVDAVLADCPERTVIPMLDRAKILYEQLLAVGATRLPFDFTTTLRAYSGMVFDKIGTIRTAESGDALVCTLVMHQIEIATVDQVAVLADAALAMSLGQQNLGSLTPGAGQIAVDTGITLPII